MSSLVRRRRLISTGGDSTSYVKVAASLASALWYRFNELAGPTLVNSGALGTAYNATWTAGAGALAQPGKLGLTDAVLFDGTATLITVPGNATDQVPTNTVAALIYPTGAGEANTGALFRWGNGNFYLAFLSAARALKAFESAATTSGEARTTAPALALNAWQWVFRTFDNTGDRMPHIYIGQNRTVTECTYAATYPVAAVGLASSKAGSNLIIGNRLAADVTFAGLYDEFFWDNKIWTPAQMLSLVKASRA